MANLLRRKAVKKSRKYPIKRDGYGLSARRRAFNLFDRGQRPAQIIADLDISLETACRYFADWKKQPKYADVKYKVIKAAKKSNPQFSADLIKQIATKLHVPEARVSEKLQQPWALKHLVKENFLTGVEEKRLEVEEKRIAENLYKLENALELLQLLENLGIPTERISTKLVELANEIRDEKRRP